MNVGELDCCQQHAALMALSADKSHPAEAAIILALKACLSDKLSAKSVKKLPNNNIINNKNNIILIIIEALMLIISKTMKCRSFIMCCVLSFQKFRTT